KIYTDSLKCAVEQLADSVAADGDVLAHEAVRKFAHQLKPIFHSLVADAALDEATQLMTAMASIKLRVSDAQQWSQAFFVICAGHQPRYKQITKRFFERWLLEETHSDLEAVHRVIYAESCQTLGEALQLVSTRIVSANLGEIFFHSPLSLDEDVLGDAGLAAIDRLFCNREI
ncbi:MAG: hypothetical protein ACXW04_12340, partial [Methylobacter sp.]